MTLVVLLVLFFLPFFYVCSLIFPSPPYALYALCLMPYAGIFFLVFVLFRPCSSCLFLFSTYVVLAAFLILHNILQNSCRLFFCFLFLSFSALCRYLLPRLRVVSPVQQLSVAL